MQVQGARRLHLNLLAHVRASWTLRGTRPQIPAPGSTRQVTVLGALKMTTGQWACRLGRRRAADFIDLLRMLAEAFPRAPKIVVICDNDNPVERVWGGLKNYVAKTAVTWPGRLRQIHSFFRNRSPDQMLAMTAPWTSPWLPRVTNRTLDCRLAEAIAAPPAPVSVSRRMKFPVRFAAGRSAPVLLSQPGLPYHSGSSCDKQVAITSGVIGVPSIRMKNPHHP
jgi:DDE superfamily endonuclease